MSCDDTLKPEPASGDNVLTEVISTSGLLAQPVPAGSPLPFPWVTSSLTVTDMDSKPRHSGPASHTSPHSLGPHGLSQCTGDIGIPRMNRVGRRLSIPCFQESSHVGRALGKVV